MSRLATAAVCLLAFAAAPPLLAQTVDPADAGRDADRAAIRAHIEGICQAFVDGDVDRIRATHTDDWRGFLDNSRAPIKGIDDYMRANGIPWPLPAGAAARNPNPSATRTFKVSDFDVHFYGRDLAVASFFVDFGDTATGEFKTTARFRIMDVYARRSGAWNQAASHTVVDPAWRAEQNSEPATLPPPVREQLFAAREAVWRAYFTNDQATLDKLVPADTIVLEGPMETPFARKPQILEGARRGAAAGSKLVRLEFPKTEVQVYGSTAILYTTYLFEIEDAQGQRQTNTGRATEIFVRRNGPGSIPAGTCPRQSSWPGLCCNLLSVEVTNMKLRSFAITAVLVACAVVATSAATRATFIMTNGQRVSGELVYHGGQGNNMIDNNLNLGNAGKEQSYAMDQVAVIDVAGGTPSQDELNKALSYNQAMSTRDGYVQGGQFVNIRNGSTLIWRNQAGQEQQYGLDQVARVYLNTQSARQVFNFNPSAPAPSASPSVGTTGVATRARRSGNAYVVQGNQPWVDTGIQVRSGDQVSFRVTGQVVTQQGLAPNGPEGVQGRLSDKYPQPQMQVGALIGRIGNGQPFPIGSEQRPIAMQSNGTLQLGINDDFFPDNSGAFDVTITVNGRRR